MQICDFSMRWTERELEQLRAALDRFAQDLDQISQNVQSRTTKQMKVDLKRKTMISESDGMPAIGYGYGGPAPPKKNAPSGTGAPRGRPPIGAKSFGAAATPRPRQSASGIYVSEGTKSLDSTGDSIVRLS